MQFDQAQRSAILAQIATISALVSETQTQEDLIAQISTLTAERDAALSELATVKAERDAAIAEKAALQTRLDGIIADIQALNAADAQEDAARAAILAKAQGN